MGRRMARNPHTISSTERTIENPATRLESFYRIPDRTIWHGKKGRNHMRKSFADIERQVETY